MSKFATTDEVKVALEVLPGLPLDDGIKVFLDLQDWVWERKPNADWYFNYTKSLESKESLQDYMMLFTQDPYLSVLYATTLQYVGKYFMWGYFGNTDGLTIEGDLDGPIIRRGS